MQSNTLRHREIYTETPYWEKKGFNSIDLLKFVMACVVVVGHLRPFRLLSPTLEFIVNGYLGRVVVPFFVAASSFFLFRKMTPDSVDFKAVWNFALRMFKLYGIWMTLLFIGGTPQLWYLPAMAIGVLLLTLLLKLRLPIPAIVCFSAFMYLFSALGMTYYNAVQTNPLHVFSDVYMFVPMLFREGLFYCFPFAVIGMLFAFNRIRIPKAAAFAGFVLTAVIYTLDVLLVRKYHLQLDWTSYLTLPLILFFIFYIALHIDLADSPVYRRLRNMSILVYLLHIIVRYAAATLLTWLGMFISFEYENPPLILLATSLLLFPLCYGIDRLSDKEKFRFLKGLYS